ncbi:YbbR family protein [Thermoanaerobacter mathranii subsp. mathranii str. A3]|uniref:YbbR family protein n=1 Tax=Thermoanaerobacter mathranii subsp. mathranii (strain DSM 11426 / CCUG 53645 / CIP 108742 / A3) TaxID=583358 RepID=A0ABM5LS35_THEM3|nr:CdaR family protein [Thermoanaerobacter mathranii]ADH61570.1 YbbR family protein [Thermoanaerobacter mathranii subsp. mathranii str. A3]
MLTKDFTIKLLSLVLAFLLWLYVMGEENPEIPYDINNVPVKLINSDILEKKGLIILDEKNYTVNVKIRGRRSDVLNIAAQNISAFADLSRVNSKGTNVIPVTVEGLPRNVSLVSINPPEIKVEIDKIEKTQMPVAIKIIGNVMEGYAMQSAVPTPGEVLVIGPESKVNLIKNVIAGVNVSYKKGDIKISVPVVAVDREGKEVKGVTITPNLVEVYVSVNKSIRVPVVPKIFGKPMEGYMISLINVLPEYVYITGDEIVLNTIKSISTKQIDISGKNEPVTESVPFDLPDGVKLVKSDINAKVYVDIQKIATKEIAISNIDIRGAEEKNVVIQNPELVVTVAGPESVVNGAKASDFNAYIDVTNLPTGVHSLAVKVSTDLNLQIKKIEPDKISVNIQ